MQRLLSVAVATLALAACASSGTQAPTPMPAAAPAHPVIAPAMPAAVNPVGAYEFSTEVNGSPMKGNLIIGGSPGAYNGRMTSDLMAEVPITSVAVDGQVLKLLADTPQGTVTILLTFTGDTFAGNWELGGQGGNLTGKRITK